MSARETKAYLNQFQIDENQIVFANNFLTVLKSQVEKQSLEIKKAVLNNQLIQFKSKHPVSKENAK